MGCRRKGYSDGHATERKRAKRRGGVGGALEKYKRYGIARNRIKLSMATTAKRLKLLVGLISIRKYIYLGQLLFNT